jgi:hypothetical protein
VRSIKTKLTLIAVVLIAAAAAMAKLVRLIPIVRAAPATMIKPALRPPASTAKVTVTKAA